MVETKLNIAFCSVPMVGHLNPLLPYAAELIKRGHSVTVFHEAHPKYRQKIESSGAKEVISVTYDCQNDDNKSWSGIIFDCVKSYYEGQATLPSVMVYEFFAVEAADAADALGVPSIGVFPNPRSVNRWAATLEDQNTLKWKLWCAFMWQVEPILARVLWCFRSWGRFKRGLPVLPEQDLYPSPYMPRPMIGCTTPLIEFPDLPEAPLFHMVGPSIPTVADPIEPDLNSWLEAQKDKPIVYVAFGTMYKYNEETIQKLEADFLALGNSVSVLWSLPKQHQSSLITQPPPQNWRVESFFPQVSLFKTGKIGVFVTHCGSNSVYEALVSGVPMVCYPQFADQPANATRLVRAGVGLIARKGMLGDALKNMLGKLDVFAKASKDLAAALNSNNAAQQAADLIEQVASGEHLVNKNRRLPLLPLFLAGAAVPIAIVALA
ncbi:Phloretin 2'-O-glucosyltransferase [Seminavis robusta]|uniref:Phloretin 2'-O-glucosyltransferase n=1 Tax=Seminavis robusta TaxID=568900 RepID=A0A9N8HDJ6_9STRA|nr:Phloretin 2'-O-glucosyltransferase [Seminavis robusta]|eukprot:Sro262_g102060.1 Phloretin 2'-O-glucosyltransferase (435) ;mRNA; r:59796-61100